MVALLKMPNRFAAASQQERRMFPRKEVEAEVKANRTDHTVPARRDPRVTLSLRDLSLGGLCASTQTPLEPGERLAVFFPAQGTFGGWDALGRVLRCIPTGFGYRIAVEFDPLPTAA
jgi:hypothetical protein